VQDLLYVVLLFAFTAIAVLFVIGCDKIVGPDDVEGTEAPGGRAHAGASEEAIIQSQGEALAK